MDKQKNISSPKIGMKRAVSSHLLEDSIYSFMLNGQTFDQGGNRLVISNEHSNVLANKFKEGYVVIGFKNFVIKDITYFFLLNPETNISEFGFIKNNTKITQVDDKLNETCKDCNKTARELTTPLENIEQQPHQEYITLLEDSCNTCLNLSIDFPIRRIEIKTENIGTNLYFTDGLNEPRYIELDNLEQYLFTGEEICDNEDTLESTCLDCEKLRIFKLFKYPTVEDYGRILGGDLKKGVYELAFAYTDQLGNELTSYTLLTNVISIFDENNLIQEADSDNSSRTPYGIKLQLSNLDTKFTHYKIVLIETSFGEAQIFKEKGIFSTSDSIVIINDNQGEPITRNKVLVPKVSVKSWDGIATSNNILFGYGVKEEEIPNLQPVFNLMGGALKWVTTQAKEDLYTVAESNRYKGYNRDEIVPFGIEPISCDGFKFPVYPLISRVAQGNDRELVDNKDTQSINSIVSNCDDTIRNERWQFYNTATEEGFCSSNSIETQEQTESIRTFTTVDIPSIPPGEIEISGEDLDNFVDLETYIRDNQNSCQTPPYTNSNITDLCQYLDLDNLQSFSNPPIIEICCEDENDECSKNCCEEPSLINETLEVLEVINQVEVKTNKSLDNYARVRPPQNCTIYGTDVDTDYSVQYSLRFLQGTPQPEGTIFERVNVTFADTCINAYEIFSINNSNIQGFTPQSFVHPYFGGEMSGDNTSFETSLANLLETKNALFTAEYDREEVGGLSNSQATILNNAAVFTNKIHKGALWFKIPVENKDLLIVELGKLLQPGNQGYRLDGGIFRFRNRNVRVHFFYNCDTDDPIVESSYEDENGVTIYNPLGGIFDLGLTPSLIPIDKNIIDSTQINDGYIYMVVDLPISQAKGLGEGNFVEYSPQPPIIDTAVTIPLNSCFTINVREVEFSKITYSFDQILLEKSQEYQYNCTYDVPIIKDCEPVPFKFGKFAFWESTEKYPDNKELYDSSNLNIRPTDLPESYRLDFENTYIDSVNSEFYNLNNETEFFCKNIRHYKFPDNKKQPFIRNINQGTNSDSIIYPIGVQLDTEVFNSFLDIAVSNGLISQSRRDNIIGYKLHRGDSTLDRSVKSSGLLFDTRQYTDVSGDIINYSNFPFNAQGKDKLTTKEIGTLDGNNSLFTYHSPESDFYRPSVPNEMSLEGIQYGRTSTVITEVEDHPKWVILGRRARSLASTLANLEAAAEITIASSNVVSNAQVQFGFTNNTGLPAFIASGVVAALGIAEAIVYKVARFRYEWLRIFRDLGSPDNFAYYNTSIGKYNYMLNGFTEGDLLRGLSIKTNIKDAFFNIQDQSTGGVIKINNTDREYTTLLSTSDEFDINFPTQYVNYDNNSLSPNNSSQSLSSEVGCQVQKSPEFNRNVASPYVALKDYIPNQYGTINSVKWIDTGYFISSNSTEDCNFILGGDTFITRHSLKRKAGIFDVTAFGQADLTPFNYGFYSNFGEAKYYIDYEITDEFSQGGKFFPDLDYVLNTDCGSSNSRFYFEPPSKFYLYYYGQPYFLTESRINTNFRTARPEPKDQFYPQNRDYVELTQQKNVNIREKNSFFYNKNYSYQGTPFEPFQLPSTYSKEVYDKISNNPNSVMYSLQDNNQNSLTDPWLVYRPLDRFNFPTANGKLKRIKGIESNQILCTFENKTILYNKVDTFVDGVTVANAELGSGAIFARRPFTFADTDLGFAGSQSSTLMSCEFGHFFVDSKRGQIFKIELNGRGIEEISKYSGGQPNDMDVWFKEHLPFKILRDFPELENQIDNPYNGVGISIGWDSKFRRVFFTKKDYVVNTSVDISYNKSTNMFTFENNEVTLQDLIIGGQLKEVSWTMSFRPESGQWESYFSFYPNYYINHTDYFQTGLNQTTENKKGLWSHLLTNRSKQVFYGEKYPFTIEYPITNKYQSKKLEAISLWTEAKRYSNQYNFAVNNTITFNKAIIYNERESSGLLEMVLNNGVLSQLSKYPKTKKDSQEILISFDDNRFNFDYFYNRTKSNQNNLPLFTWDENQIQKDVNYNAVSFRGKKVLERMTGTHFLVRLTQDNTSQFDLQLNWADNTETPES